MTKIAFLGTGEMGARMATRLLAAGHDVTVWSRSAGRTHPLSAAGAGIARTPRAAVREAEIVIAMTRDDDTSRHVWLDPDTGALEGLAPEAIAIECATITPAWARELNDHCTDQGNDFLDAPVAGSRPQAEAGALIFLAGGRKETLARARPILEIMGWTIHHIGPAGAGALFKLAVNALFGIQVAAMGELLALLQANGIGMKKAAAILGELPVTSPAAKGAAAAVVAGNFAPLFPISLVVKDFAYALAAAEGGKTATPLTACAHRLFARADDCGLGGQNINAIARLYDGRNMEDDT